ncbi:polypyrimidine tract-binding protein homolog 1 isoform X1 [Lycium ferocissimum]|uniref:polypyrimidine tract-binding protein homolog 1 isoform X1 n=1 Tax=Lycium ferocissimum TaxID=112874 RepID=UPI0028157F9F|nr:polypyrimidine tract-binding protein homolog 1 isoform X1 [Lycium ferocissimum]
MSTSGQQQFRYTQTPSKVLHLRNLPWDCSDEELVELCKPFGKIVNTKCNVGANRNQAFVEFADLNQAINMVSYYASSSEPAQVRGKTVYIQYSNRNEIVNNKSPGDVPGNVLLVTIEGVEAGDVSIDVIHLVFSAFGFVQKIATFEKAAGFQALIQFSDVGTASAAREALDGRSIPKYLLPEHVNHCHLRISYSAHTDLNIKFQSHRSRDYTNPYLPVNPTAMEGLLQPVVGPDGKKKEPESNVLFASLENMQYAVTVDVLHTVFSAFGTVQKIAIFEKNGQTQALIQYPDVTTAAAAKDALEGHCIYDGGYCKLHLSYSRHTDLNVQAYSDKSRDYTVPESSLLAMQQASAVHAAPAVWHTPQSGPAQSSAGYAAAGVPGQAPTSQSSSWNPNMQGGGSTFPSAPTRYPGQSYAPPVPGYATAVNPPGSSQQTNHIATGGRPFSVSQPFHPSTMPPGGVPPPGHAPYHG